MDSAEEAYRAAIKADPGHAEAHNNLGILLEERAKLIEESKGTAAAALCDEFAQLWGFSHGRDHELTKDAEADAARVRAVLARSRRGKEGRTADMKGGKLRTLHPRVRGSSRGAEK